MSAPLSPSMESSWGLPGHSMGSQRGLGDPWVKQGPSGCAGVQGKLQGDHHSVSSWPFSVPR